MKKLIAAIVATTFAMGTAFAQAPAPAADTPAAAPTHKKAAKSKHKKAKKADTKKATPTT